MVSRCKGISTVMSAFRYWDYRGCSLGQGPEVVQLADVRMVQRGHRAGLGEPARNQVLSIRSEPADCRIDCLVSLGWFVNETTCLHELLAPFLGVTAGDPDRRSTVLHDSWSVERNSMSPRVP